MGRAERSHSFPKSVGHSARLYNLFSCYWHQHRTFSAHASLTWHDVMPVTITAASDYGGNRRAEVTFKYWSVDGKCARQQGIASDQR
ncbi:hypothetical protein DE4587_00026 [Mycobacteroides salmoniphilum]|nr:hypothetical protein DE4586_00110 [Mycobacteroides salmoniphilum]TDZ87680.1 hypothetical protein DE4587_00026 [Mycobacteroides salmoniphilum]